MALRFSSLVKSTSGDSNSIKRCVDMDVAVFAGQANRTGTSGLEHRRGSMDRVVPAWHIELMMHKKSRHVCMFLSFFNFLSFRSFGKSSLDCKSPRFSISLSVSMTTDRFTVVYPSVHLRFHPLSVSLF